MCLFKDKFLYSAVSNPQDSSKCNYTLLPGRTVQSNTVSASQGSIQPHCNLTADDYKFHNMKHMCTVDNGDTTVTQYRCVQKHVKT